MKKELSNNQVILSLFKTCSITLILLFSTVPAAKILPRILFQIDTLEFKTLGLYLFVIVIFYSITASSELNNWNPTLSDFSIALVAGTLMFILEFVYKLLQSIFIFDLGFDIDFALIFKVSLIMGLFVLPIAHLAIRKMRNKKVWPLLLAYFVLMAIAGQFIES